MSITLCNANGNAADTPAYRQAFRDAGLPISNREMRQLAVHRSPNYGHMSDSWHDQISMAVRLAESIKDMPNDPHVFVDWEYPNYSTRPMTRSQLAVRTALHSIYEHYGIPVASWGVPYIHERSSTWTNENALELRDQLEPISDFFIVTMTISAPFYNLADRHRYVAIAREAVRRVSATGKPVFISFETFVRNGDGREDMRPEDAVTIGAAARAVDDAGGFPLFWTELVNGKYDHQTDALDRIGPNLAEGWNSSTLTVQATPDVAHAGI